MKTFKKSVHYGLLVAIVIYLISGLGITYYRVMEKITFGVLTKALSFKLHDWILYPFLILLALHLYITIFKKKKKE
ncbi:hypothetical protein KKA15_02710 [Patescibacteria group bacterium]|nr:hypothetical protein [Patescibacteria group bacterium]